MKSSPNTCIITDDRILLLDGHSSHPMKPQIAALHRPHYYCVDGYKTGQYNRSTVLFSFPFSPRFVSLLPLLNLFFICCSSTLTRSFACSPGG